MPFERQELNKFTDAGKQIAASANASFEQWATGEMGVVLKTWTAHTNVITPAKAAIEARAEASKKVLGDRAAQRAARLSLNTGRRGGAPGILWRRNKGQSFWAAGKVEGDSSFSASKGAAGKLEGIGRAAAGQVAKSKAAAMKAIGLARQSIIQSADMLGIVLESVRGGEVSAGAISSARQAVATNGQRYQNGTGTTTHAGGVFTIEAVNSYPLNAKLRMDVALANILQARATLARNTLQAAMSRNLKKVEAAYPFLKVS